MFKIIEYKAEHLEPLVNNTFNAYLREWIDNGYAKTMERPGKSGTIIVNDEIMLCGGVTEYWPGRALMWTLFNEKSKHNFLPTFRGIKKFIADMPYQRLELAIPRGAPYEFVARRRAELLGFELECERARKYSMNGGDAVLYALIKGENYVV